MLTLVDRLSYAGNEAARRYLDGEIDAGGRGRLAGDYGLYSRPRAEQRVRFIDQYRSYVINYNLGKDMVARVHRGAGRRAVESGAALGGVRAAALVAAAAVGCWI